MNKTCTCGYSYILLTCMEYDGPWINGVVKNLKEAERYYENMYSLDFTYIVQVWKNTKRICSYEYNIKTKCLEKQELKYNEIDYDCCC